MPQHGDKPGTAGRDPWQGLTESPSHVALTFHRDQDDSLTGQPMYLRKQDIVYIRQHQNGGSYVAIRDQVSREIKFIHVTEETSAAVNQLGGLEASGMVDATLSNDDGRGGGLKMYFPLNAAYMLRPSRIKSGESVALIRQVDETLKFTFRESVDQLFAKAGFTPPKTEAEKSATPTP